MWVTCHPLFIQEVNVMNFSTCWCALCWRGKWDLHLILLWSLKTTAVQRCKFLMNIARKYFSWSGTSGATELFFSKRRISYTVLLYLWMRLSSLYDSDSNCCKWPCAFLRHWHERQGSRVKGSYLRLLCGYLWCDSVQLKFTIALVCRHNSSHWSISHLRHIPMGEGCIGSFYLSIIVVHNCCLQSFIQSYEKGWPALLKTECLPRLNLFLLLGFLLSTHTFPLSF